MEDNSIWLPESIGLRSVRMASERSFLGRGYKSPWVSWGLGPWPLQKRGAAGNIPLVPKERKLGPRQQPCREPTRPATHKRQRIMEGDELRNWYAGMAMQAILIRGTQTLESDQNIDKIINKAFLMARRMMQEAKKKGENPQD